MNAPRALISAALLLAATTVGCSAGGAASTPAPASSSVGSTVVVVLKPTDCKPDKTSVPAGVVTFNVTNQGADSVSELELKQGEQTVAEKENLTPSLNGSFTVTLSPGTYVLECPGATTDESDFTVN